jgi:hypothetical protein
MEPTPIYFDNVKRSALVLRPKQAFVDWLQSIEPMDDISNHLKEGDVYLLPDYEEVEEMEEWLSENFDSIFSDQLNNWYTAEEIWPQERTFEMFKDWFEYTLHTMIWDTEEDEIEKV